MSCSMARQSVSRKSLPLVLPEFTSRALNFDSPVMCTYVTGAVYVMKMRPTTAIFAV